MSTRIIMQGFCGFEDNTLPWTLDEDGLLSISGPGTMLSRFYDDDPLSWDEPGTGPWGTGIRALVIGEGVTDIGDYAFCGCVNLTSATLPDSVTEIGERAFAGCASLTSLTLPACLAEIGDFAFSGCRSLTSLALPESLTAIGKNTR